MAVIVKEAECRAGTMGMHEFAGRYKVAATFGTGKVAVVRVQSVEHMLEYVVTAFFSVEFVAFIAYHVLLDVKRKKETFGCLAFGNVSKNT